MTNNNQLTLTLQGNNVNGFPSVRLSLDDILVLDTTLTQEEFSFQIPVSNTESSHRLKLERYGKQYFNTTDYEDQILEISSIKIDEVELPDFIIHKHSKFEFLDQCHYGSTYFGPNGSWTFDFGSPIITWVLDCKIMHESQYSQDYQYPWSYKLGPNSVVNLTEKLSDVYQKVQKIL